MIKYTRHEQENIHLQEALGVMLNILSYLNNVMHSTQIVGYPVNKNYELKPKKNDVFCFLRII